MFPEKIKLINEEYDDILSPKICNICKKKIVVDKITLNCKCAYHIQCLYQEAYRSTRHILLELEDKDTCLYCPKCVLL